MNQKVPIVAIVGRANVGKSSLFNALLERREAIVAREEGTTRDSIMAKAEYHHRQFWLVDTAGMKDPEDEFELTIQEQILQAVESADIILVVAEADVPIAEEDRTVSKLALKSKKPVVLIVNKLDKVKYGVPQDFERLGIKPILGTSVPQHKGIEDLREAIGALLPKDAPRRTPDTTHLSMAIVGRPNVGKSRLFNSLAKKQQAIVADQAGTTRDVNRIGLRYKGKDIELLDTAGIRRSGKIQPGVERFSVLRALSAIEQADICILVMDVNELTVQLDQKIAGLVKEAGKGLILAISKWDTVNDKDSQTSDKIADELSASFDFVPWAPLIFTSAVSGQNVTRLLELALAIYARRQQRPTTAALNRWLQQAILEHPPAGLKNRAPKLNYMVQEIDNPIPAFKIFGSQTRYIHWSYRRYLEHSLRDIYDYSGTPIQLWFIEKHVSHRHGESPTRK